MISIKNRQILVAASVIMSLALPATGFAEWCTGSNAGKFSYDGGSTCTTLPTSDALITALKAGNSSFVGGNITNTTGKSTSVERTNQYNNGQKPNVIVLTCSDSRVPPEILFNKAIGEVFTIRVAGNVLAPHEIGSIEYAVEHLGASLIVVLGHERCGAVKTTFEAQGTDTTALGPNLNSLIDSIKPAVTTVIGADAAGKSLTSEGQAAQVEECVVENIKNVTAALIADSAVIQDKYRFEHINIVQAKYDLDTGSVSFFDPAPITINFFDPITKSLATSSSNGNVTMSWAASKVSGSTYTIDASTDNVVWSAPLYSGTSNSVTIKGLADGIYIFRISDGTTTTISKPFTVLKATTPPATIVIPATNVTGRVAVSWTPASVIGSTYTLESAPETAPGSGVYSTWTTQYTGLSNSTTAVTGLNVTGNYKFRVKATKTGFADGGYTTSSTVCTITLTCTAPLSIMVPATPVIKNVSVSWSPSTVSGVTYIVEASKDNFSTIAATYTGMSTSTTFKNLTAGSYKFQVRATKSGYTDSANKVSTAVTVN